MAIETPTVNLLQHLRRNNPNHPKYCEDGSYFRGPENGQVIADVKDGATSLFPEERLILDPYTHTDSEWLVKRMMHHQARLIAHGITPEKPRDFTLRLIQNLRIDFERATGKKPEAFERAALPTAAGITAYYNEISRDLTLIHLGDCQGSLQIGNREPYITTPTFEEESRLREEAMLRGLYCKEFRRARQNLVNTPEGYGIYGLQLEAADMIKVETFHIPSDETAMLALGSDGFFRALKLFGWTPADFMQALKTQGVVRVADNIELKEEDLDKVLLKNLYGFSRQHDDKVLQDLRFARAA